MAERLDPVGGWPAERVPGRSVPGVVLRYRRDGEWHCAPRVRARCWWILPGPHQLSSRWSTGCVALAKAAGSHQVCGLKDPPASAGLFGIRLASAGSAWHPKEVCHEEETEKTENPARHA